MSLNRFTMMTSRARARLTTLVTQGVVNHLSGELDILCQQGRYDPEEAGKAYVFRLGRDRIYSHP